MTTVKLNKFKPRSYQLPVLDALENKGFKRVLLVWPRRAGKDVLAFNYCIRCAIKRPQVIYYIFPTYAQAKKVIWDSITNTGERFLDYIPSELIESSNSQEMKIRFKNGSLLQLVGSDNVDTLVGSNPQLIVFSEYALQDPRAYTYLRPILVANSGCAIFVSTPRGRNHLFTLYEIARNSPDWYCSKLTVLDTGHISMYDIEKEKAEGLISEDLIQQEYFCSFSLGIEGGYYTKYVDKMRLNNQIGDVPYESNFKVNTTWDLGMADCTSIIFFQIIGTTVRIIDCYENSSQGLEHYAKYLQSKPYVYGKHFAPHDIKVRELGTGISRLEKARELGIDFLVADNIPVMDGIEAVRSMLSRTWIDEKRCVPLIKALENYRREYDAKRQTYKDNPLHDFSSHFADSARYMAVSLPKTRDGMSAEDLERQYQQAVYGSNDRLPRFFDDRTRNY
jgi:phage terminase large subunit